MSINKKNIIDYFQSGSKSHNECDIGIEHEKFLVKNIDLVHLFLKRFAKFIDIIFDKHYASLCV